MLRSLAPTSPPIDMLELLFSEARAVEGRPWVMLNMVESVDGSTAVEGGASALNDEDDRAFFQAMRAVADVVLAGAQTIRSEQYGPLHLDEERIRYRRQAGMADVPLLAIPTRSLNLDPGAKVFSDPNYKPMIITGTGADETRLKALAEVSDIAQTDNLDGQGIIDQLSFANVVLCEGGPTINSQLLATGMVDEIAVTVAPLVALGESQRIAHGDPLESPIEMRLDRILQGDRSLFLRYLRD